MKKETARKIKLLFDHYQATSSKPEVRDDIKASLLAFMDGYVSAVLEERSDE